MSIKNLIGQEFGRLVVVRLHGTNRHRQTLWACVCSCGRETIVARGALRSGNTRSCGCLHGDMLHGRRIHGKEPPALYQCWLDMKKRCSNKSSIGYRHYGSRGIAVCKQWANDFPAFRAFALSRGWRSGLFIDRIDNDGGYSPGNCRFVVRRANNLNTRRMRIVVWRGETRSLHEWSAQVGIKYPILRRRLWRGWSVDRALTQPPRGY